MKSSIDDLVSMRDVEGLVEIMQESNDWMDQLSGRIWCQTTWLN